MIPAIPWYITAIIVATNLAIAAGVWRLVASATPHRGVHLGTALFLGAWLGAALLLAPHPGSVLGQDRFYVTPLIPLFASVPAAVVLIALRLSPAFRQALAAIPLPALHGIQVYRVIGAIFVFLLAQGQLPAHFAQPAGWGDIASGSWPRWSRSRWLAVCRGRLRSRPPGTSSACSTWWSPPEWGPASSLHIWRPGSARGCRPPRPWGSSPWCWCRSSRYRCR